ncbi:MAG: hypothetical protein PHT99_01850 [Methanoregula sp.]|nr:hypothetical protein [Methanoregula sp.]
MKRGRPATRGIKDAVAIAQKRGCVMQIVYASDSVCDLLIRTAALVIFVRIVRSEKIIAPVHEIVYEYREIIAELRLFPPSLQIQTELWIYTRHGTYRFFRLTDAGLEEIQQDGETAPATIPAAVKEGDAAPATVPDVNKDSISPATIPVTGNKPDQMPGESPT